MVWDTHKPPQPLTNATGISNINRKATLNGTGLLNSSNTGYTGLTSVSSSGSNAFASTPLVHALTNIKEISEPIAMAILDQNYDTRDAAESVLAAMLHPTRAVVKRCLESHCQLWDKVQNIADFKDLVDDARSIAKLERL